MLICKSTGVRGPQGDQGPSGQIVSLNLPKSGRHGNSGSITISNSDYTVFLPSLSLTWIGMQLHRAEIDYINGAIENSKSQLIWLLALLQETNFISEDLPNPTNQISVEGRTKDEIAQYLSRVKVLLTQISQGLDYYGNYHNYTPLTSVEIYKVFIEELLKIGQDIENAYQAYMDKNQDETNAKHQVNKVINSLNEKTTSVEAQQSHLMKELEELRSEIKSLLEKQVFYSQKLELASEEFKKAIERKSGCGFSDVILAASAIVSLASGASAALGGLAATQELSDLIKQQKIKNTIFGKAKYLAEQLRYANGGLREIQEGYKAIKPFILSGASDSAKLIISEQNFEEVLGKFEDMPEAQDFRNTMREYLSIVKLRNNQILYADSVTTKIYDIETEKGLIAEEVLGTQAKLLEIQNPFLAKHIVFFERAVGRTKREILRAMSMKARAISYWSLKEITYDYEVNDATIDHLRTRYAALNSLYLNSIEERNSAPQEFNGPTEIVFSREKYPEMFLLLDSTGEITFEISENLEQYKSMAFILVKQMSLRIDHLNHINSGYFEILLTHHGNPVFLDTNGSRKAYCHRPRKFFYHLQKTEAIATIELGGEMGKYSHISPFATWSIAINKGSNSTLDTSKISLIAIMFSGIAFARR